MILIWLSGHYGREFSAEATYQNLTEKTWILSDALTTTAVVFLDPYFTTLNGCLGIKPRDYQVPDFEDHLKMTTPEKTIQRGTDWWEEFWGLQFNCSEVVASCGANLTLHHALQKIRGSFVSYVIDAIYAIAYALDTIYRCSPVQGIAKRDTCPSVKPTVKGRDLEKYIRNVSFDGWTGKVQFDKFGDPLSAVYDIINFQLESTTDIARKTIQVGVWDKNTNPKLTINASKLRWKTVSTPLSVCSSECLPGTYARKEETAPCCWDYVQCPGGTVSTEKGSTECSECGPETKSNKERNRCEKLPVNNMTFTSAYGITMTVMASIGYILTLLVCGIYIKFYKTPIVKASNKEFTILFLLGISALFILAVLELHEPSDLPCIATTFWHYFAHNLCVTVLFLKTMRITSVFEVDKVAQWFTPCYKTLTRQTIFISAMNVVPDPLLVVWMSVDPPGREKIIRSNEYIFLVSKPYYTNTGFALIIAVSFYTLTVALFCTYYAFKARGIPENFNETKYIGFAMYILLLSSIAYYPVAFTFDSWYVTLVSCLTTLVSAFGLLGCMFGPKVYVLLFRPQQNTLECVRSQVSNFSFKNVTRTTVLPAPVITGIPNSALEPENLRAYTNNNGFYFSSLPYVE